MGFYVAFKIILPIHVCMCVWLIVRVQTYAGLKFMVQAHWDTMPQFNMDIPLRHILPSGPVFVSSP